ncbi:MAG TPA: hypothetical protein VMB52_02420 [Verrucomicrobiae bacterium]|nr:hypothetical protein [Verrucomicrobiae bacterium]
METATTNPNQAPLSPELTLAHELEALVKEYDLDPTLADLFAADGDTIYQYEGIESDFPEYLAELKLESVRELREMLDLTYGDGAEEEPQPGNREARRTRQSPDYARRTGGIAMGSMLATDEGQDWAQRVEEGARDGLGMSRLATALGTANNLNYGYYPDYCANPMYEYQYNILFGHMGFDPADFGAEPAIRGLTTRLDEMGVLDLSKEMLDTRVERYAATMQIEAARIFLIGLSNMTTLRAGTVAKQTRWLAARYKDVLLVDDYDLKIEMMNDMAKIYRGFALREVHTDVKYFMELMARSSARIATSLAEALDGFKVAYEGLDFELHPLLQTEDTSEKIVVSKKAKASTDVVEAESDTDDALLKELDRELANIRIRLEKLAKAWRMNSHERRSRGVMTMYRELVGGFRNFVGQQLLKPMNKKAAQAYVDIAVHLYDLGEGDEARQLLFKALLEQAALKDDIELCDMYARELGVSITWPPTPIPPIQEVVREATENWAVFRQLVLKTWPGQGGVTVLVRLEQLLFNTPQAVKDDQPTQAAVREQLEVAELLDMLVLPPDATREDLTRALESAHVERLPMSVFEWQRLENLVTLREEFGGQIYRTKDREKWGSGEPDTVAEDEPQEELEPEVRVKSGRRKKTKSIEQDKSFWVLIFRFEGDAFVIAESAFSDHATFVICDRLVESTALQVLGVGRREAPSHGAHRVVHAGKLPHRQRVQDKVLALHNTHST